MSWAKRICICGALAFIAGLIGATAFADPVRQKSMASFLRPGYPVYLAQAGFTEFDAQLIGELADKAAVGLDASAPAGCDAEAFSRDLCGFKIRTVGSTVMEPTIGVRDLVAERGYGAESPRRGDIITFRNTAQHGAGALYVMRLIGLPGDTVELRKGVIVVNGASFAQERTDASAMDMAGDSLTILMERTADERQYRVALKSDRSKVVGGADDRSPVTVPDGHYYVLGDNRHNSADSRFPDLVGDKGFVPAADVSGKIVSIVASADRERIGALLD